MAILGTAKLFLKCYRPDAVMLRLTIDPSVFPESHFGAGDAVQPLPCSFPAPGAVNGAGPYSAPELAAVGWC